MEQLLVLVLVLFVIAVLLTAVVLPIVALVVSSRTRKRLSELQARIDRIEKTLAAHSIFPSAARPEPEARPAPAPEPVTPPPPTAAPEPPPQPITPAPAFSAYQLESIIGRRGVGWVAVILHPFRHRFLSEVRL